MTINCQLITDWQYIKPSLGFKSSNVGSVVEFSPATREARVRFPDVAILYFFLIYFNSLVTET